jgi:hypothetical protein
LEYPVICRLVGPDYFRQLARTFLACHPSRSGDLHHVGAAFASFLRRQFGDSEYLYLADVAALEWAYQECLVAEEVDPFDPRTLRTVPPQTHAMLRFGLRPSYRLVQSQFPVLKIWQVNQPESAADETIDLHSAPDFLLVFRSPGGIYIRRIDHDDYRLLAAFAAGTALLEALDSIVASSPQFDVRAALRRCIELAALFRIPSLQNSR